MENKEKLLNLWKKKLNECENSFNINPISYKHLGSQVKNEIDKDKYALTKFLMENTEGKYISHTLTCGTSYDLEPTIMPITLKDNPPIFISKVRVTNEIRKYKYKGRQVPKKILGIKYSSKIVYDKPKLKEGNDFYQTYTLVESKDGSMMCSIINIQTLNIIQFGKIISFLTDEEYQECVEYWEEVSIKVDQNKLDKYFEKG